MSINTYEMNKINNIYDLLINPNNFDINIILSKITDISEEYIIILLNEIANIINQNINYSYKYSNYEKYVELITSIIDYFFKNNKKLDIEYNNYHILKIVSNVKNSQNYLKKIKKIILKNNFYDFSVINNSVLKSSFPTFLFWWNNYYIDTIFNEDEYLSLLSKSIINPDDRIFEYLLLNNNLLLSKNYIQVNLKEILILLISSQEIPRKFKQKKLKLLSTKFNLDIYFNDMINYSNDLKLIDILFNYYYKSEITFNNCISIIRCTLNFDIKLLISIYNKLISNDEKYSFIIICYLNSYFFENLNININIKNINLEILNKNYEYILPKLDFQFSILYDYSLNNVSHILNAIFKYYLDKKFILKFLINSYYLKSNYYKYTKFYILDKLTSISISNLYLWNISINKGLHLLRCLLKYKINNKKKNFNYNFKPIINEIVSFKPNNKIKILKNGSINYQLNKQKFNKIPPRHLLPLENILDKEFLIKEKADGLLTYILPNNIKPINMNLFNYEIKGEFMEELNVYLIYDINIPNMTVYERHVYLRSIHPATKNNYNFEVNSFNELLHLIEIERINFNNFIENNKTSDYKWYPKAFWKCIMNNNIYINLINIINENSDYMKLLLHYSDGIILTPLDGTREIKIKPKKLQSIDLLYDGNNWLDSNNKKWEITKIKNKKYENKIYRCYPVEDKYIATEIRYDKKYPNSFKIIDQIQHIYKFDWTNSINVLLEKPIYYELTKKNIDDIKIIDIINIQYNNFNDIIKEINPEINKLWLDLGCGKCKLLNIIKNKYLPKKYLGIDNDINILSSKYNLVDDNIYNLLPINLLNNWNDNDLWENFDWNIKYDYIIANFSIMHFWSKLFWTQLNKIVNIGSKFIFNVVKPNMTWKYNNSYLISNEYETKLKFEWSHINEHQEQLITNNMIIEMITLFNWNIIKKIENNKELSNCYICYVLEKK